MFNAETRVMKTPKVDTSALSYQLLGDHLRVWRHDGKDGISWDQLQAVKNEAMGEDTVCIEIYPAQSNVVNDVNMRHLWAVPEGFPLPRLGSS